MAPKKRKGGTAQRDRSDSEAVASDATTSTVSAAAPARKSAKSSKASTRGRSGSAGSSTTGRSRSRDVESEFDNEYEDEAAFQAAVSAHDVNALKIISPISIDRQSKLLKRFKEFLAAAMDRKDSKEKRLEAADALIGRDKPLPAVTTLLEFLTFWAKGSKSKMVEGARMNHASFEAVADQLMTAVSDLYITSVRALLTLSCSSVALPSNRGQRRTSKLLKQYVKYFDTNVSNCI